MGVFKNDVGRPSNKTILIRRIIWISALALIALSIGVYFILNQNSNSSSEKNKESNNEIIKTENKNDKTHIVKFYDGDQMLFSSKVDNNSTIEEPENPIKEGYVFVAWYLGDKKYDFSKKVKDDIKLVAKWKEENKDEEAKSYTITFEYYPGKVDKQIVSEGNNVIKPATPSRSGYIFNAWLYNGEVYNFNSKVNGNISLVAKWDKLASFNTNTLNLSGMNYKTLEKRLGGVKSNSIESYAVYNTANGRGYNSSGYVSYNNGYVGNYEFWTFENENYDLVLSGIQTKLLIVPIRDLFNDYSNNTLTDEHLKAIGVTDILKVPERDLLQFKYDHYVIECYGYSNPDNMETIIWDKNYKQNW